MTKLVFHVERSTIPADADGLIHVWLYGGQPPYSHTGSVGAQVYELASHLGVQPSIAAVDFLSVAMAVTAADTFVARGNSSNAWSRTFEIILPVVNPSTWNAVKPILERVLRFLSADHWFFEFVAGGVLPPSLAEIRRKREIIDLSKVDCVSLFSGGLDSAIGAIDFLKLGARPLLVSHSPRGDATAQDEVAALLPSTCQRFSVNSYPTWQGVDDDSMRTRSFQFLALGALAGTAISTFRGNSVIELNVCENGLIALNPPLTPRRQGSHSTRTAHPYFLDGVREIMSIVGLPVKIRNPYEHQTKGEMVLARAGDEHFDFFVSKTVSCGKWKRKNQQCGRCVPCLIRRAALHRGGVTDLTSYQCADLQSAMLAGDTRDDLVAVQTAVLRGTNSQRWVLQAGPLPIEPSVRASFYDVAARGLTELADYLRTEGFVF
jgi:hypothetical protein